MLKNANFSLFFAGKMVTRVFALLDGRENIAILIRNGIRNAHLPCVRHLQGVHLLSMEVSPVEIVQIILLTTINVAYGHEVSPVALMQPFQP